MYNMQDISPYYTTTAIGTGDTGIWTWVDRDATHCFNFETLTWNKKIKKYAVTVKSFVGINPNKIRLVWDGSTLSLVYSDIRSVAYFNDKGKEKFRDEMVDLEKVKINVDINADLDTIEVESNFGEIIVTADPIFKPFELKVK